MKIISDSFWNISTYESIFETKFSSDISIKLIAPICSKLMRNLQKEKVLRKIETYKTSYNSSHSAYKII